VRMEWPARFPDLNPIEHCWDMLQRAIAMRSHQPQCLRELQDALQQEWSDLEQLAFQRLIRSMRRHFQTVINVRASQTRY